MLAVDGSTFTYTRNERDQDSFFPPNTKSSKGYNQVHVVSSFDLLSKRYTDCIVQPIRKKNEFDALTNLIDRHIRLLHIASHSFWNVCCLLCCAFRSILDCFADPSVCLPDRIGGRTGSFYLYLCPGQLYDRSSADVGWHFHLVGEI